MAGTGNFGPRSSLEGLYSPEIMGGEYRLRGVNLPERRGAQKDLRVKP